MEPRIVALREVRRVFDGGRIEALRGVNLDVSAGEFIAVTGPSGCGKTTLLNLLGVLDKPSSGEILYRGRPLNSVKERSRFRAQEVGFVFQAFHLLPTLTALENVQIPMFEMPWSSAERVLRARHLLEEVGLASRLEHLPSELSGGERQRVAAARSLANGPSIILADEPTGNLDSANSSQLMNLLSELHDREHVTLVVATHDLAWARRATRVLTMCDGVVTSDTGMPSETP